MSRWEKLKVIVEKHDGNAEWVAEALYAWLDQHNEDDYAFMLDLLSFLRGRA